MAKLDIRGLNFITSSTKQSTFNIDFAYTNDGHIRAVEQLAPSDLSISRTRTFFADIGEEESLASKYQTNKASLYDISNDMVIHNIYDITKTKLKSGISSGKKDGDTISIFASDISDDFLDLCQFETYAYGLSKRTSLAPTVLSITFNNYNPYDYSYHYAYGSYNLDTHLYRPLSSKYDGYVPGTIESLISKLPKEVRDQISSYQDYILSGGPAELSAKRLEKVFDPVRKIRGVKYNYLLEIPEAKDYNDYSAGHIYCNTFICKNDLDYTYSMDFPKDHHYLSSCRDYVGLGVCGGSLFMKYRDNVSFAHNHEKEPCYSIDGTQEILVRPMHENKRNPFTYQHIEVIESLNRYDTNINGHKSSLYSIRLYDTGLNQSNFSEIVKDKLRQNIVNNIRTMASKICPANTQLFNVYFEGK